MNKETTTPENAGHRAITIGIFIVVIVFLVWLAVQAVGLVPNAFTSLASLANSLYQQDKGDIEIIVSNNNAIIDHNQDHTLTWNDLGLAGNYYFSYECTDGVTMQIKYPSDTIRTLACDEEIDLGNSTKLDILVTSSQKRFTEVHYSLVFIDIADDMFTKDARFTVLNPDIPTSQDFNNDGEVAGEDTTTPEEETPVIEEEEEVDDTPIATPRPTPQPPVYVEVPIYEIPKSNPDGFSDLKIELIGVGYMTAQNQFVKGSTIDSDSKGAIQFKITNLGTKTSQDFTFSAALPNGQRFNSNRQNGLKPNEHSLLTLGFTNFEDTGLVRFGVVLAIDNDSNLHNNAFESSVVITD